MDANKRTISEIFNGSRIIEVPYYQRSYVWGEDQWNKFMEDMVFISTSKKDYFLGSVILKQNDTDSGSQFDIRTVIDGQQRFTTFVLFAKALCLKTDDKETFDRYFTVRNKKTKSRDTALIHSLNDRDDFNMILTRDNFEEILSIHSRLIDCYNFFLKNIDCSKLDIDAIISHSTFVAIDVDRDEDEQVIFENINSLGVRLTTAELLKNYFFTESTREEYEELWVPIFEKDNDVKEFWDTEISSGRNKKVNIDAFFTSYLFIKIQDKKINIDSEHKALYRRAESIFNNYKSLISTYKVDKESMLYDIMQYATTYQKHFNPSVEKNDLPSESCFERINFIINVFDSSTMMPYVLYVLQNVTDFEERNKIFGYLENYILRRQICNSSNNNYSDFFSESLIGSEVLTFEALKSVVENKSVNQALSIPNDDKVKEAIGNIEHNNKKALAILFLLESKLRSKHPHATKLLPFDNYSLEHIMPRKYEKNWPLSKGYDEEKRKSLINTLGNMALLPQRLNSSISNSSWKTKLKGNKKQEGLLAYASDIEILKDVINKDEWDEDEIIQRADNLSNIVNEIWPSHLAYQECFEFDKDIDEKKAQKTRSRKNNINFDNGSKASTRDLTKYSINKSALLSKADLVFEIVKLYTQKHPSFSYKQIKSKFNDDLCAKGFKFIGFLCTKEEYDNWKNKIKDKRYKTTDDKCLIAADGIHFYVSTQWTKDAMTDIIKIAIDEGFDVKQK